jgi:uncharacterized membrane protein
MAGVGFALRRLVRRDDLSGLAAGYGAATVITSGPWLFTIVCLGTISALLKESVSSNDLNQFRGLLIYSFCFSMLVAAPIAGITTRYVSDRVYEHSLRAIPSVLFISLGMVLVLSLAFSVPFVIWAVDAATPVRSAAVVNFCLLGCIWNTSLFLSTLREHSSYAALFAGGLTVSLVAAVLLGPRYGVEGMLQGFNLGLAVIFFSIVPRVMLAFPQALAWPKGFLRYFRRYWELALGGIVFSVALWVDKWLMWFAPDHQSTAGLRFHPDYDVAMYLAYLSIIPAIAVFFVSFETGLFERLTRYFGDINDHATYKTIEIHQREVREFTFTQLRSVLALQCTLTLLALWLAPQIVPALGGSNAQIGIFRLGVLGAMFHVMVMFLLLLLSYFDQRRVALRLQVLLLCCNAAFTWISRDLGFSYYGYGYFAASLVTFVAGYAVILRLLRRLPFVTFVKTDKGSY